MRRQLNELEFLNFSIGQPYNLIDCFKFFLGALFSLNQMWKPLLEEPSFIGRINEVEIPVFFLAGRYDYNTPSELVEKFYDQLVTQIL
jgi:hypothetical protein